MMIMAKILTLNKLLKELAPLRNKKRIGLITGCFDVLHIGHIEYLKFAKEHADILVVGLDGDAAIKLSKGEGRPINKQMDRCRLLAEFKCVDYVFPMTSKHHFKSNEADAYYERTSKRISPDIMFVAVRTDKYCVQRAQRARRVGAKTIEFHQKRIHSTTNIVNKILKVDL
jgi:rfaE bifunctional protein nucleotidyltransferase chain/domain